MKRRKGREALSFSACPFEAWRQVFDTLNAV